MNDLGGRSWSFPGRLVNGLELRSLDFWKIVSSKRADETI
jgi:hypothetical protein